MNSGIEYTPSLEVRERDLSTRRMVDHSSNSFGAMPSL